MNLPHRLQSVFSWTAVGLLALLPLVVAIDYGGVLHWTQYVTAIATAALAGLTLVSMSLPGDCGTFRRYTPLLPLSLWLAYSCFQSIPISPSLVARLSPASADAYTEWINPLIGNGAQLASFPISLAAHDSLHACAIIAVVIGLYWCASTLFADRRKVVWLMSTVALGVSIHVMYGIWRLKFPVSEGITRSFGTFINRNNAALMMNLGLGCSLGLLAWRLAALRGSNQSHNRKEHGGLFELVWDRDALLGLIGATSCAIGLLVGGSRGGLFAALIGVGVTAWLGRRRESSGRTASIVFTVLILITLILIPLNVGLESVRRAEALIDDPSWVSGQDRLTHWRDGLATAIAHFPAGSGLSSYAYAHLPHQEHSSASWFHHADNLWLELLTEQGMVGMLLALSILLIAFRATARLTSSPDPIDHGVQVMAYYVLAVVIVSQLFDFGLILIANLFLVTVLLAAAISRSSSIKNDHRQRQPAKASIRPTSMRIRRGKPLHLVLGSVSFSVLLLSLPRLKQDAEIESAVRQVDAYLDTASAQPEHLVDLLNRLDSADKTGQVPSILHAKARVLYRQARIKEVLNSNPPTAESVQERYRLTGPSNKRLDWLRNPVDGGLTYSSTTEHGSPEANYHEAFSLSSASVRSLPLSRRARMMMLYLDFVPQDRSLTSTLLRQMSVLFRNQTQALIDLGRFAADTGERDLAVAAWTRALSREPRRAGDVIQLVAQTPLVDAIDVLPDSVVAMRFAAPQLLKDPTRNREALEFVEAGYHCDDCETKASLASCKELIGDVSYGLDHYSQAFAAYQAAISQSPVNAALRLKFIERLVEQRQFELASTAVNDAIDVFPQDTRFLQIRDSLDGPKNPLGG